MAFAKIQGTLVYKIISGLLIIDLESPGNFNSGAFACYLVGLSNIIRIKVNSFYIR